MWETEARPVRGSDKGRARRSRPVLYRHYRLPNPADLSCGETPPIRSASREPAAPKNFPGFSLTSIFRPKLLLDQWLEIPAGEILGGSSSHCRFYGTNAGRKKRPRATLDARGQQRRWAIRVDVYCSCSTTFEQRPCPKSSAAPLPPGSGPPRAEKPRLRRSRNSRSLVCRRSTPARACWHGYPSATCRP